MCLVPSVRCRPGLTHAGNISLQLLRCTSDQGAGPTVGWGRPIYLFYRSLARRELITNICQGLLDRCVEKVLLLWNLSIYSVFHFYLGTWYLANDWFGWRSSGISLSAEIICSVWEQNIFFRYTPYMTCFFCCKNLYLAMVEASQRRQVAKSKN